MSIFEREQLKKQIHYEKHYQTKLTKIYALFSFSVGRIIDSDFRYVKKMTDQVVFSGSLCLQAFFKNCFKDEIKIYKTKRHNSEKTERPPISYLISVNLNSGFWQWRGGAIIRPQSRRSLGLGFKPCLTVILHFETVVLTLRPNLMQNDKTSPHVLVLFTFTISVICLTISCRESPNFKGSNTLCLFCI